ncbi:hypothetical protein BST24_12330 [Mycobacteroides franklinii]|nr:hypothetical protein BST24_12330 [Mycobacteroides franklinii]
MRSQPTFEGLDPLVQFAVALANSSQLRQKAVIANSICLPAGWVRTISGCGIVYLGGEILMSIQEVAMNAGTRNDGAPCYWPIFASHVT